jgi:hypothetical protein
MTYYTSSRLAAQHGLDSKRGRQEGQEIDNRGFSIDDAMTARREMGRK